MNALGDVPAASAGAGSEDADIEGQAEASEEVGDEQRKAIVKRDPKQPTREEIELHEATGHVSHRLPKGKRNGARSQKESRTRRT